MSAVIGCLTDVRMLRLLAPVASRGVLSRRRNDVVDKAGRVIDVAAPFDVVVVGNAEYRHQRLPRGPLGLGHETDVTENLDGVGQSGGYRARGFARLGYRLRRC